MSWAFAIDAYRPKARYSFAQKETVMIARYIVASSSYSKTTVLFSRKSGVSRTSALMAFSFRRFGSKSRMDFGFPSAARLFEPRAEASAWDRNCETDCPIC